MEWLPAVVIACLVFVVFIILLASILVNSVRDSFVFRPTRTYLTNTARAHVDRMIGDVMTRWFDNGSDVIMLYLHGNNGNISDRAYVEDFADLSHLNLVLMDYRGYGMSKGVATLQNMREDADEVMKIILQSYTPDNVIVMAESLGSIPASYLAAKYNIRGVAILGGISSFNDMADEYKGLMNNILSYAIKGLGSVETNKELLARAQSPVMIVHSTTDEIVTFECAKKNVESCPKAELVVIGGGHATPVIDESNLTRILGFMGICTHPTRYESWRRKMSTIGHMLSFCVIDM